MPVDVKEARAVRLRFNGVIVPDFIVECSCHGLHPLRSRERFWHGVLGGGLAECKAREGVARESAMDR
jgi:hypothetical protein